MNKTMAGVTLAAALASLPAWAAPTEIKRCQTISEPGPYVLVNNLSFPGATAGTCLLITADFVTIDLAGFHIDVGVRGGGTAVKGNNGITVRNGSIAAVDATGVALGDGSIVEGLQIAVVLHGNGISANGIVRDNTIIGSGGLGGQVGISNSTGVITHNYVAGLAGTGIDAGAGSTVIGNTSINNFVGIIAECPVNLTDNTAVNNRDTNLILNGEGCHNEDNVAP
jgi:hypothetical protein